MIRHPKPTAMVTTLLTLMAGITTNYLANFGVPLWVYFPLFLLLCTAGLPTTLGVILTAGIWGRLSWFTGLYGFFFAAAFLGLGMQIIAFVVLSRWYNHHHAQAA